MASTLDSLSMQTLHVIESCWSSKWFILLFVVSCSLLFRDYEAASKGLKAPIVGRWPLEPYFLTGLRFKLWSMIHLSEGYRKVSSLLLCQKRDIFLSLLRGTTQFKTQMFKVIRFDGMVLVIPRTFVEELRSLPEHQLSLRHLQVHVSVF